MPRPKRTKIAPSAPASRAAKPFVRPKVAKDMVEDISDDGEGIATSARRVSKRNASELSVAREDNGGRTRSARAIGSQSIAAIEAARKRRDAAIERLQAENDPSGEQAVSSSEDIASSPPVEVGRRAAIESSILAVGNFRRRPRQPSILGRGASRARSSSVESNLAESDGLTGVRAIENSLARGHFRRRQRQPSILGRANSRVRSSSVGLEMDRSTPGNADSAVRHGVFRSREPQTSISGTGMKNRERPDSDSDDDEDDFNPDDESTPLNLSKARPTAEPASQSISSTSNPRKRKLSPLQVPPSSHLLPAYDASPRTNMSTSPLRPAPTSEIARPATPEPLSDTMAPPRSSSPAEVLPVVLRPSQRTNAQSARPGRRQPARKVLAPPADDELPSSPPSLTHSPDRPSFKNRRQTRGPAKSKPIPANLSTIQLQALLPRRRRRPPLNTFDVESSEEEVDVSGLGSDDDELTHATVRTNRTTRSLAPHRVTKLKPGPKTNAAEQNKTGSKITYGARRTSSDKENEQDDNSGGRFEDPDEAEADPDDSLGPIADTSTENSQELEERVGKELKQAKRKFEVVDKWELDFEDMTGGSSSPRDAR
jgi:hypothetical protein